jgi:hypothetical protein
MANRIEPDHASLVHAHHTLHIVQPLAEAIKSPALALILKNVARRHMERRSKVDVKKLQSNDHD